MATKETLDRLEKSLAENTSVVKSAEQALDTYVATNADLVAKLQAALQGDDEAAVKAAADALDANNAELKARIPAIAQAVDAGTA